MKKRNIVVIAVVIFLVVCLAGILGILFIVVRNNAPQNTSTQNTQNTDNIPSYTNTNSQLTTYSKDGVSFVYPSEYTLSDNYDIVITRLPSIHFENTSSSLTISANLGPNKGYTLKQALVDDVKSGACKVFEQGNIEQGDFTKITLTKSIVIGNLKGCYSEGINKTTPTITNTFLREYFFLDPANLNTQVHVKISTPDSSSGDIKEFEDIIKSFKVTAN